MRATTTWAVLWDGEKKSRNSLRRKKFGLNAEYRVIKIFNKNSGPSESNKFIQFFFLENFLVFLCVTLA